METWQSCSKDSLKDDSTLKEEAKRLSKGKAKREDKEKDEVINRIGFLCRKAIRQATVTEDQYYLKNSTIHDPGTASFIRKSRKYGAVFAPGRAVRYTSSSKFALRYPPIRSSGSPPTSQSRSSLLTPLDFSFGSNHQSRCRYSDRQTSYSMPRAVPYQKNMTVTCNPEGLISQSSKTSLCIFSQRSFWSNIPSQ